MNIQTQYSAIYTGLIIALIICAISSFRSDKSIGKPLGLFLVILSVPLLSNILIMDSHNETLAIIGYYAYYISMTLSMIYLVNFSNQYCKGIGKGAVNKHKNDVYYIYTLALIDIIQLLLGPFFHHVFTTEMTIVDDEIYYKSVMLGGLLAHRIVGYIIYMLVFAIFTLATLKTTRYYREKYSIVLFALILSGLTQTFFIISRTPVDRAVLVHALLGILIYYLSIKYRPLKLLDTILSNVVSGMDDSIYVFDQEGKCIWANEQGYALLELPQGKHEKVRDALIEKFGDTITNRGELWNTDVFIPNIKTYYHLEKKSVKSKELIDGSYLIIQDTTDQRSAIKRELYNSTHDRLTGLYNEEYLYTHIRNIMRTSSRSYYALWINIKNFKLVNDVFGKRFGDHTLKELAEWIKTKMKDIDGVYGRLVGDTFCVLLPVEDFDAEMFHREMSNFVVRQGNISYHVCIHAGVYKIYERNLEPSIMFDRAHMALSGVKDNYKSCIRYYDDNMKNSILKEQGLVNALPDALKSMQIRPYLQPITDASGNVIGAESLARWMHPKHGFLHPNSFIPLFEHNGMVVDIDRHIWRHTCEILKSWKGKHDDLFISVNISPRDFYFTDVVKELLQLTKEYDIEPVKLRVEITETVVESDTKDRLRIINELKAAGFIVEMDDFGSGYSSLNMLKNIPVDLIKIDMNFLAGENTERSEIILKNVINLSKDLNIVTLTEGVETEEQFNKLVDMGCSLFQGFYFSKPLSAEDFEAYLTNVKK